MEGNLDKNEYWKLGYDTILELETEKGILASGKEEIYGCIFGRDTLITSIMMLSAYRKNRDEALLRVVRKALLTIVELQGSEVNIESGEEPGKAIHEFRESNHEHLTKKARVPWYVYPDGKMRIYDSVDSTPLLLVAIYKYYQASKDGDFLNIVLPGVYSALDWIRNYGDKNGDGLIDYEFNTARKFGGLRVQSWMDSTESVFDEGGAEVLRPIAPVEVQAYAYWAYRLWAKHFRHINSVLAGELNGRADALKEVFADKFTAFDGSGRFLAFAVEGSGKQLSSVRSSMGHCLWASLNVEEDGIIDGIVSEQFASDIVERLMRPDIFEPTAGIRTLSASSKMFDPMSYHNGSIWPHDNAMLAEGFDHYGHKSEAARVRGAIRSAYGHFKTPIELFVFKDGYEEYRNRSGQVACRKQAWSAAAMLGLDNPMESGETVKTP